MKVTVDANACTGCELCVDTSPEVFDAAHLWVECADWITAMLTGTEAPDRRPQGGDGAARRRGGDARSRAKLPGGGDQNRRVNRGGRPRRPR